MTINKAMNISLTGLTANQQALNVVSHNIANMNTEGYVKQRVNFAELRTNITGDSIASRIAALSGVQVSSITTSANDYLNNYYRTQNSIYQGMLSDIDTANQIADLMDALKGAGLGDSMADFFSAANALNQNPTDYSLRINFSEKAKTVANKFNAIYGSVNNLKISKIGDGISQEAADVSQAGEYVEQLNSKLEDLAKINTQLSTHADDASLKTRRDQILSSITSLVGGDVVINKSGTASVSLGGVELIKGNNQLGSFSMNADGSITFEDFERGNVTDVTNKIEKGLLGGTLNSLSSIDSTLNSLDDLAKAFIDYMNNIQTQADANGSPCSYNRLDDKLEVSTTDLFVGDSASTIKINDAILQNPDLIAASRVDTTSGDWEKSVGNGDNALLFYNAQSERLPALGGLTMSDYIISLSTKSALNANSLADEADIQGNIVDGILNQIFSETGVNLDEELSNMIMYQQAYNASARVFSCCVDVFDTLVSLGQ